jgi:hypothetical protein
MRGDIHTTLTWENETSRDAGERWQTMFSALENRRQVAERVGALLERLVARWCGILAQGHRPRPQVRVA